MNLLGFRQKKAIQIDNWFTKKGNYQIVLNYQIDSSNPTNATSKQIIFANGKELFFNIQISFSQASKISFGPEHKISCFQESKLDLYFLSEFLIYRILPPDDKIKLVRKWKPKKDKDPFYSIINKSKKIIYGVDFDCNFFGDFYKFEKNSYYYYIRGGRCGNTGSNQPVKPNKSGESHEQYIIGGPIPFKPGKYRYSTMYSLSEIEMETIESIKDYVQCETSKKVYEFYELHDDFEIR